MARSGRRAKRRSELGARLRRLLLSLLMILMLGPPIWVLIYRWVPPPITVLMVQRLFEGKGLDRRWVSIDRISPDLVRGVIAAEDSHFCAHDGFDAKAIEAALRHNQDRPGKVRGGSTISQQTAKNVFLWPQRSWVRKGAEAGFTVLIEHLWGKRRIMEVYLNSAEMGPGVYGAEAAAQRYFHVSARRLSAEQASRLAAILPSPLKWKPVRAGPYVRRRTGRIEAGSETVDAAGLAACVLPAD